MAKQSRLSARERQIMDAIYSLGDATATQVIEAIPNPPSRSAVRTFLRILEEKGHLKHRARGREYIYRPVKTRRLAGQNAVHHILQTFFGGSLEQAVSVHLANPEASVSAEELERLESLIREAREKGQ